MDNEEATTWRALPRSGRQAQEHSAVPSSGGPAERKVLATTATTPTQDSALVVDGSWLIADRLVPTSRRGAPDRPELLTSTGRSSE